MKGHHHHQGADANHGLRHKQPDIDDGALAGRSAGVGLADLRGMQQSQSQEQISPQTVVELHKGDAIHKGFRPFALPFLKHNLRQETAIHQRPCVVNQTGMVARNKGAQRNLDER